MLSRFLTFLFLVLFTSCAKEFRNPYDPATPPDVWMPKAFKLDTLGTNALRLSWNQDERHIDGFAIQKSTNGQLKEILLPLDSLRYTDTQSVDTSSDEVCPELSYKVMARAGNNRSLDIGTSSGIRMPLSTPAIAGTDILVTDTSTTVQLNAQVANAGERGQWTIVSGTGGSFSNLYAHNSNFTGTPCTDYVLRWTKSGCTETYDEVSVKFQKAITIANAGANQNITSNATQVTLNANNPGEGEFGIWTIVSGSGGILENPSLLNTLFTGQSCTNYTLRWTITDVCNSSVDEMSVNFQKSTTTANAGSNQTITSNATQVILAANAPATGETGTWAIVGGTGGSFSNANSENSTFSGNACTNYFLRWTISGPCSSSIDELIVNFQKATTISNAGDNQTITSNTTQITLASNTPAVGETGVWSIVSGSGGIFSNANSATCTFTGNACTSYSLRWTINGLCSSNYDDVTINFQQTPNTANAGSDQTVSNLTVNLTANSPANGVTGTWSIVSGLGGSFTNINSPNSTFTGVLGDTFTLKWTLSTCNTLSFDEVVITFQLGPHTCGANNVHNPALSYGNMSDQQGNVYKTIVIGSQEWMAENLKTTIYRNGEVISNVTDNTQWLGLTTGAQCSIYNSSFFDCPYGKLYNWYAVVDSRNVCPSGWHVPTTNEWTVLSNYLGGENIAGGKMKSIGTQYWESPNSSATNESGFSFIPIGSRYTNGGAFGTVGQQGGLWLYEVSPGEGSGYRTLEYSNGNINGGNAYKWGGFSVRCLRN